MPTWYSPKCGVLTKFWEGGGGGGGGGEKVRDRHSIYLDACTQYTVGTYTHVHTHPPRPHTKHNLPLNHNACRSQTQQTTDSQRLDILCFQSRLPHAQRLQYPQSRPRMLLTGKYCLTRLSTARVLSIHALSLLSTLQFPSSPHQSLDARSLRVSRDTPSTVLALCLHACMQLRN